MWHGIQFGMKRATFCGRIIVPPNQNTPPYWRYDKFQNNYLFSSYHMSQNNLEHYYEKLLQIEPKQIDGYPSSIYTLARYILDKKLSPIKPIAVLTSAETLGMNQREIIEQAFGCKVADQYGSSEMSLFVSQCEFGTYHVNPDYGIIEVLDKEGNSVPYGSPGEAVCTSFINKTMPLIRYRLGDIITISDSTCKCGRNFPVMTEIIGRKDDILLTSDGRPIGRLDPVFKGQLDIKETQIIQDNYNHITLNIVKGDNFNDKSIKILKYEISKRVGSDMNIDFNFIKNIPRDKNGKFRSVISLINKNSNE